MEYVILIYYMVFGFKTMAGDRIMTKHIWTKEQLLNQLNSLPCKKGKIVTVHTSLKAVGEIEGGGETHFTRDGGLLCIPTHTWDGDVYDRRRADACIGVLPRLAAAHPEAVRTMHPTHSMAVFGDRERVERFVGDEAYAATPADPKGCLGKLYKEDGDVLLIGVGQEKNTFLHCVEEMLGVPRRLTDYKVEKTIIHKDGTEEKRHLYWFDDIIADVSVFFPKFEAPFRHYGCISDGFIGEAKAQFCNARKMYAVMEKIYKNNKFGELLSNDEPIDERLYR